MRAGLLDGLMKKRLKVAKAGNVNGSVVLHFHNKAVPDVTLTNSEPVDVFKLIGVNEMEVRRSNIESLLEKNVLVITA